MNFCSWGCIATGCLALVVAANAPGGARTVHTEAPSAKSRTWDLDSEFSDRAAWDRAATEIITRAAAFERLRGAPITTAQILADRLDEVRALRGLAGRMARFAILKVSLDDTVPGVQARLDAATEMEANVEAAVTWIDTAVAAIEPSTLAAWAADPRVARHGWFLHRIRTHSTHLPPADAAAPLAMLQRNANLLTDVYDSLMRTDLDWPVVKGQDGKDISITPQIWGDLARESDTAMRRSVNTAIHAQLRRLEEPLGLLLVQRLEINLELAHLRGYDDAIDAFFAEADGVPPGSYRMLAAGVRARPEVIAHFARLVGQMDEIPTVELGDLAARVPVNFRKETFAQAAQNVVAALAPLGTDYQARLRFRLAEPWMDWAPAPHKNGGGVFWQVGGGHPYASFVFDGTARGERALAAVGALTMFYADLPADKQPERREEDFPIYGNAIWFMAQLLQVDRALAHSRDRAERVALLREELYRLWNIYYQNVAYTEVEARIYSSVAAGAPMSGAEMSAAYGAELHTDYPAAAGVSIEPGRAHEVLVSGNAYYGEVLTEWAFAMAAACDLVRRIKLGDATAIAAVTHPLARPESFTSYDVLRDAGVDLTKPATYDAVAVRIELDLDRLEREVAGAGR